MPHLIRYPRGGASKKITLIPMSQTHVYIQQPRVKKSLSTCFRKKITRGVSHHLKSTLQLKNYYWTHIFFL
ncbi:hypothetical protein DAI22_12g191800 [Oryza sativa Japonica Group]|nr:hypothetical protein DAI22_12g191800 [Oryza sativa Japonica Group]